MPACISTQDLGAWEELAFFADSFKTIDARIEQEIRAGFDIWPRPENIFRALRITRPEQTRVVILGQDPYPTPGHADGLAFSVPAHVRPVSASLRNIFQELENDFGATPENGDLTGWANQGVLLLNSALSVRARAPGSHASYGWRILVEQILTHICDLCHSRAAGHPVAFVLWGKQAQAFRPYIDQEKTCIHTCIVESAHPSPLSAWRGFFGSRPFTQVNTFLRAQGHDSIDWSASC